MYQGASVERRRNPRERASLWSVFGFLFTLDIFRKARKRDLIEDDLYEPLRDMETSRIGDRLELEWEKELQVGRNSLTRALARVFGKSYMLIGVIYLIGKTILMTASPLILGRLVSYFQADSTMSKEVVCIYGGLLVLNGFCASAFNHHYHLMMSVLGIKIKASIVSLLYRKALRLTSGSLMELTSGKFVTLVSKDSAAFESALTFFHDLWIGVLQLFIINYIMYQQIQEASFVGIGLLLALIPIQIYIAKFTKIVRLKMAAKTDERLKRMQEILTSIKLLKMYNWGEYYTNLVNNLRIEEMYKLRLIFFLKAIVLIISQISQRLSFYLCITYYIYQDNFITAEKTFIILGCYNNLRFVLTIAVPMCVSQFAEARAAMKRIKQALLIENVPDASIANDNNYATKIDVRKASVDILGQRILAGIDFEAHSPNLVAVTGNVGSGKSTFLKMLLKEIRTSSGSASVTGSVSYASQDPWLFPGSIRQNILFGQNFDREKYQKVIRSCALVEDLESFALKDNTVVNDKGLNLSKGQQARINLARAVYKDADVYLLDDVMVSLDATVSKHIFENCFQRLLKDKLIVFVCHNKKYLKVTKRIVVLNQGQVQSEGRYEDLKNQGIHFTVDTIDSTIEMKEKVDKKIESHEDCEESSLLKSSKQLDQRLYAENQQEGKVKLAVYKSYLDSAGGWKIFVGILCLFTAAQAFSSYFDYYIKNWLKIEEKISRMTYNISMNLTNLTTDSDGYISAYAEHVNTIYVYTFLIGMIVMAAAIQLFVFFGLTTRASRVLHNTIFSKITSATMSFFDQNLSGNVLNRFSKDIGTIDESLPYVVFESFRVMFYTLGITAVITAVSPMLLPPTLIMFGLMLLTRRSFLVASRGLKRLDGMSRAPVVGFLNSSLDGLATIRASGNQALLTQQFDRHQDLNTSSLYMFFSISRAFGFWLDCMCKVYILFVTYVFIFTSERGEGAGGNVGVVLMQAFGMMGLLQWGIRQWAELENQMTCVERVAEYGDTQQEKQTGEDPNNWPLKGHIEYRNVCMSYFTGKRVLNNVNFAILPGERVGIVGRTGAGKSSIIAALFRLYDIKGSIIIDDVDIKSIELPIVRSKISIIPQDPVLFAGTIRSNLDPEGRHTDLQLWKALGEVELKYDIESLKEGLSTEVQEGGGNFSVGQRQLICLARAALRDNNILVLDEATANIDPVTDALIQTTIRRLFTHCTILTIAHRLHTVIDSDRIIVVDNGEVIDFDSPVSLLQRKSGMFYSMAKAVGIDEEYFTDSIENQKNK